MTNRRPPPDQAHGRGDPQKEDMMGLQYENRRGKTYYLQEGKTPKGKPKYYMGQRITGTALDALPEGYEIYESPEHGQTVVRKCQPTTITANERATVDQAVRRFSGLKHFIVEIEGDSLVVWTPSMDLSEADDLIHKLAGAVPLPRAQELQTFLVKQSHYMKMLRFVLVNPERRDFAAQRWCFRGSIDDWIHVGGLGPLSELIEKYAKHLGRESFFELI
jgi:hypothetical protein